MVLNSGLPVKEGGGTATALTAGTDRKATLQATHARLYSEKYLAFHLAKYYYDSAYYLPVDVKLTAVERIFPAQDRKVDNPYKGYYEYRKSKFDGRPNETQAIANKFCTNTPKFLDHYYPDGATHTAISVGSYDSVIEKNFISNYTARPTQKIDANRVWFTRLKGKDRRQRYDYLTNQWTVVLPALLAENERQQGLLGVTPNDYNGNNLVDTPTGPTGSTGETGPTGGVLHDYSTESIKLNVGMVNEAYFGPTEGFQRLANMLTGGNKPGAVESASELWKASISNKGLFWLYVPKESAADDNTIIPEGQTDAAFNQYVFQFHYNPATIDMAWAGSPDVDITMEAAGQDTYNLLGSKTSSTIAFDIVLNRMYDMQYYNQQGVLKAGHRGSRNPYSPNTPSDADQKAIYNKGTMYDLEHLLGTVIGFKLNTRLRGSTTDIGFITGRPVDLHLGNALRYWGYVSQVNVSHKIFDERMVPVLSTVSIAFNRIPDYAKV